MWETIKGFFGSDTTLNKGMDMVESGIDMTFYTPEEKSIAHQKILDWRLKMAQAIGPQSKARRYLTYVIGGVWTHNVLLMTYFYIGGILLKSEAMTKVADKLYNVTNELILPTFLLACAFYYAANIVRAQK